MIPFGSPMSEMMPPARKDPADARKSRRIGWLSGGGGRFSASIKTLRQAVLDFWHYQGVSQAAALAFYALLSFIPLLFLIIAIAGMIWGDPDALQHFVEEQDSLVVPWVRKMLHYRLLQLLGGGHGLGWMSLGFIVWTSGLFFAVMQSSLLLPWQREHDHKKGIWRWGMPWVVGPALGFLLPLAMLIMHVSSYMPWDWLPVDFMPEFWTWALLAVLVFSLYKLFLPLHVPAGVTLLLSMVIAGASQALTLLFSWVFSTLPSYSLVYGSLASIVLFLLWLEYNMALILLGGHCIRLCEGGRRGSCMPPGAVAEADPE